MSNELAGKVAIVTGGASGLGRGHRRSGSLAEGAKVRDRRHRQRRRRGAGRRTSAPTRSSSTTDVGELDQVSGLVVDRGREVRRPARHGQQRGRLGHDAPKPLRRRPRRLRQGDAVNLLGVMAGTRDAARHMREAGGGGSIINITSIGGILAGGGVMTYRASKAAVIQFTKSAAIELAHYEIRVNCHRARQHPDGRSCAKSATGEDLEQLEEFEAKIRADDARRPSAQARGHGRRRRRGGAVLRHRPVAAT